MKTFMGQLLENINGEIGTFGYITSVDAGHSGIHSCYKVVDNRFHVRTSGSLGACLYWLYVNGWLGIDNYCLAKLALDAASYNPSYFANGV